MTLNLALQVYTLLLRYVIDLFQCSLCQANGEVFADLKFQGNQRDTVHAQGFDPIF